MVENLNLVAGDNITLEQDGSDLIITGEAGSASGTWVGTTEPTDENINLWINPDEVTNTQQQEELYSTSEIIIGRWIDGKPIYRKAFEKTNLTTGENTFSIGISNVQSVINLQCNVYRSNGYWHPLTFANSSNLNVVMSVVYLEGNISINIGSGITNASKCVGYIEYTKTTD